MVLQFLFISKLLNNNYISQPIHLIPNKMFDQQLSTSRTSLTTNSSRGCKIVRKRDSNMSSSLLRSKSKSKQDQRNASFEQYLSKQSQIYSVENEESIQRERSKAQGVRCQRLSNETSLPSTLIQTISNVNLSKAVLIERGDRYINHRLSSSKDTSPESKKKREKKSQKQEKIKKREPTPVKSKKLLSQSLKYNDVKEQSSRNFELELKMAGLEESLNHEKKVKLKIQNQLKQAQKDVKNLRQILSQIEMENRILHTQKKTYEEKIQNLQKTVLQSQSNLTQAHNNLNKLRQTIKQNRITELQAQMKKLSRSNETLKQTNTTNQQIIASLNQKLKGVSKELEQMKKIGNLETLALKQSFKEQYLEKQLDRSKKQIQVYKTKNISQKQVFLQSKIIHQQKQIYRLSEQIKKLQIKIHFFESSKSKQIEQIKQKSDCELKALRVRYSKIVVQLKNVPKGNRNSNPTTHSPSSSPNSKNRSKNSFNIQCKCIKNQSVGNSQNLNSSLNNKSSIKVLRCGISNALMGANRPSVLSSNGNRNEDNFLLELSPE